MDFLPYISWSSPQAAVEQEEEEVEGSVDEEDSSESLVGLELLAAQELDDSTRYIGGFGGLEFDDCPDG